MKRSDAIRRVKRAALERQLLFTRHALDEMDADGETRESVAATLERATGFALQDNGRWRVHAEGLTVIVHCAETQVLVWTVFVG